GRLEGAPRERAQVRVGARDGLADVGVRGERTDLGLGVSGEQPEGLATGVTARACDGDGERHARQTTNLYRRPQVHAWVRHASCSRTWRLARVSIPDMPRRRSGLTTPSSPSEPGKVSGTARTCSAVSPVSPCARI